MDKTGTGQAIDNRLADFTDQVIISGKGYEYPASTGATEDAALQSMVVRILKAFPARQPEKEFQERIRNAVIHEFRQVITTKGMQTDRHKIQIIRFAFAFCVVSALVIALVMLPDTVQITPGAANSMPVFIPAILILGIIAGIIFWQGRRN